MNFVDLLTLLLLVAALFFFTAGTIGLVRLPDLHSRLHALTKADNVGLGFTVLALMLQADGWATVFKLGLIWMLVLASGATVCFLIASRARGQEPRAGKPPHP
jgi:multicomponent Na+:H+ antiporter subunit G